MKYAPAEYAEAFLEAGGEKPPAEIVRNFFRTLRKNGDLGALPKVLRKVEVLHYSKAGLLKIEVITARDINKDIEPQLKKRFGKKAEIRFEINPEIIGGIILRINDELVIDASVKRRIDKLFQK